MQVACCHISHKLSKASPTWNLEENCVFSSDARLLSAGAQVTNDPFPGESPSPALEQPGLVSLYSPGTQCPSCICSGSSCGGSATYWRLFLCQLWLSDLPWSQSPLPCLPPDLTAMLSILFYQFHSWKQEVSARHSCDHSQPCSYKYTVPISELMVPRPQKVK